METKNQLKIVNVPLDNVLKLVEQSKIKDEYIDYINSLNLHFVEPKYESEPKYLGINKNVRFNNDLYASYYIGVDWLTSKEAVLVKPKLDIDFVEMFTVALKNVNAAEYFSKFYGIKFNEPKIKIDSDQDQLTPLLLIHFLSVIKKLLNQGLRYDYVKKEENLKLKIKGKILVSKNITKNSIIKRNTHIYCKYQEYSADIPENRLLKKALLFTEKVFNDYNSFKYHKGIKTLKHDIRKSLSFFEGVSDQINIYEVKHVQKNRMHKDYNFAIKIAKMILRKFDYSINNAKEKRSTYPYWIDMSRLYEVYLYGLLLNKYPNEVLFQVKGYQKTALDFAKLDEKIIIDAKYKPRYNDGQSEILDDIRQISGYARDKKILKEMGCDETKVPECLIIYPDKYNEEEINFKSQDCLGNLKILEKAKSIKGFVSFYKLKIALPIK